MKTNYELIKQARANNYFHGEARQLLNNLADALEKSEETVRELSSDEALNETEAALAKAQLRADNGWAAYDDSEAHVVELNHEIDAYAYDLKQVERELDEIRHGISLVRKYTDACNSFDVEIVSAILDKFASPPVESEEGSQPPEEDIAVRANAEFDMQTPKDWWGTITCQNCDGTGFNIVKNIPGRNSQTCTLCQGHGTIKIKVL